LEVKDFVEKLNIYVVFIQGGSLEKKAIWQGEIGMRVSNVIFAMTMRR
jgi:hypothetical protein